SNNLGVTLLSPRGFPPGNPGALWGKTDTLASYAYDIIYTTRDYGLAAAYAAVTFVMIAALIVVSALATKSFAEVD
ncbi:MAG: hypothetical protein ACR2LS_05835, partial [Thermomicrobiales bacterium]